LYIIPTVDTENPQTPTRKGWLTVNLNDTEIGGVPVGAVNIADIFSSAQVSGTFFLAPDEVALFGDRPLRTLAQSLSGLSQDIQLHTHPFWRDPRSRRQHMWEYSFKEQKKIIKRGLEELQDWTGLPVVAHRAGAYSLNKDTIDALGETGIEMDSSMLYRFPNCRLNWSKNQVVERNGIVEVPVSVYSKQYTLQHPFFRKRLTTRFMKFDLDSNSEDELRWFVDQALSLELRVVTFFMHSYSLIKTDSTYKRYSIDDEKTQVLKSFLAWIKSHPKVEIINVTQFLKLWREHSDNLVGVDCVPYRHENIRVLSAVHMYTQKIWSKLRRFF
jgi:hypothetical protein